MECRETNVSEQHPYMSKVNKQAAVRPSYPASAGERLTPPPLNISEQHSKKKVVNKAVAVRLSYPKDI